MEGVLTKDIFEKFKNNYVEIFSHLYPSEKSTGFTERNLSVNFVNAYIEAAKEKGKECIAWYEFQFKTKQHYDVVLVNLSDRKVFIIESKRYNNRLLKMRSVNEDIDRIKDYRENFSGRLPVEKYEFYGVILADIWTGGNTSSPLKKAEIVRQYREGNYLSKNPDVFGENGKLCCAYDVQGFSDCRGKVLSGAIINYYYLLTFWWKL